MALDSIHLLGGEKIEKLHVCYRLYKGGMLESKKGLLVITNKNLLFQQQEGILTKHFHTALRIPLTQIHGITSGGTLTRHIKVLAGIGGSLAEHEFNNFVETGKSNHELRSEIENDITEAREEQEEKEKRERVHILLDFAFLRDFLKKGGLLVQNIQCPRCSAPIEMPNSGDHVKCEHCGSNVLAQNIFAKIKELVG